MRILLADHRHKVRFALRALLEQQPDLKVVGEAADAEELLALTEETCPDLVLVDWELPGLTANDHLSALRRVCPDVFLLALSGRVKAREAALGAGADAFVSKGDPPERLLAAIDWCGQRQDRRNGSSVNRDELSGSQPKRMSREPRREKWS
jgi:DNA-binding NarL/FixJ family response regulator